MVNHQVPGQLAEKGVLAGILDVPEDLYIVMTVVSAEDFAEPRNAEIFSTIVSLAESGMNYDPVSVASRLEEEGKLRSVGGVEYIAHIVNPTEIHSYDVDVVGYAAIVRERSQRRQILNLGARLSSLSNPESGHSPAEMMSLAEDEIRRVADVVIDTEAQHVRDATAQVLESISERANLPEGMTLGVPSGFVDLDNLTTGWKPGQFIIVAARPAQGKTTIALDFARTAAVRAGMTTMFFSLEMGKEELLEKVLSAEARIDSSKLKKGNLDADEWERLREAAARVEQSNLIIDASPGTNISHIRAVAQRQKNQPEGLDLIVLDYLQLLSSGKRVESRQQEVSEFSRNLKLLAKEFAVPVIALSQLNRGSEQRTDKTPLPSDMRESGSLEQDADIILLLHRPEVYDPDDRPGLALLNLAKHRGGPTAEISLIPMLHHSKFVNSSGAIPAPVEPDDPGEWVPDEAPPGYYDEPPAAAPAFEGAVPVNEPTYGDTPPFDGGDFAPTPPPPPPPAQGPGQGPAPAW